MNQKPKIVDTFLRILEHLDVFEHKQESLLDEISLAEVHCIDCIGMVDHPNVTKISEKMGLTRGAISKINKRLTRKGLIESYQKPENNKEIYFRLTERGKSVYSQHKKLHDQFRQMHLSLLEQFDETEQAAILRYLTEVYNLVDSKSVDEIKNNSIL